MKKVICSYSSAYPSRLASRRQNCLADCLNLDCQADYLDLNCLDLNYFFDYLALTALTCRALYRPAQTRRVCNQPIVDQQDNVRLDPVEEIVYLFHVNAVQETDLLMRSISGCSRPGLTAFTPVFGGAR